jgi:hypothetical protein
VVRDRIVQLRKKGHTWAQIQRALGVSQRAVADALRARGLLDRDHRKRGALWATTK